MYMKNIYVQLLRTKMDNSQVNNIIICTITLHKNGPQSGASLCFGTSDMLSYKLKVINFIVLHVNMHECKTNAYKLYVNLRAHAVIMQISSVIFKFQVYHTPLLLQHTTHSSFP